jgi:PAS domain S-box-containing protein
VRLTEPEYRALVEHSPVLIWRAGLDARWDYFNEPWLAFTGRTLEEERGDGWTQGVHPEDLRRCLDHYRAHFERREAFEMEYRLRRHDGVYRWILDRGAPFHDDGGAFAGFTGSCIDVDERRRAQEEREQRALDVASAFERWVLGIVGHDLRNPLSAIAMSAELLQESAAAPAAVQTGAARISRAVDRIKHLVDDLLDLTRARQGGIAIAKQDVDLAALCREAIDELGGAEAAIELRVDGDGRGAWDPRRVVQAVSNLVGHAVQHRAPDTPVRVTVAGDADAATVEVHHQGEIPAALLPTLFDPFHRGGGARKSGGLGLGLFIASAIAKAHGGALDVSSSADDGTRFRLRLPRTT